MIEIDSYKPRIADKLLSDNLLAFGAVNIATSCCPKLESALLDRMTWPISAGRERKAVAKMTGMTPAEISFSGRIERISP